MAKPCLLYLFLALLPALAHSEPFQSIHAQANPDEKSRLARQAASHLAAARAAYDAGRPDEASALLETYLAEHPQDPQARGLLTEVLVASSVEAYLLGDEEASYKRLSRAMEVTPDVAAVNGMYEKVKRSRFSGTAGPARPAAQAFPDPDAFGRMLEKVVAGQAQILEKTQGTLGEIVKNASEEKAGILRSMEKRDSVLLDLVKFTRKISFWTVLGGFALVMAAVSAIFWLVHKIAARRERLLREQGERFFGLIEEKSEKVLDRIQESLKTQQQIAGSALYQRLAIETNTAAKLRQIDIIDAEIVKDGGESTPWTPDAIKILLEDSNPEVRARTIQVLLKYNPDEAYRRIQEMISGSNADSRALAARLLGGIATRKSAEILIQSIKKEEDHSVKRQAMSSLRALMRENLPRETIDEIDKTVTLVAETEGWIVQ
ncbi:MAG: hypothetical protein A2636_00310 [Elusimicrobia bacterium RIFCSPHIGHO2_01_FULL_64_10]|nr:MAG: hypothetical protein A2636_00310 [Elusimicrobia bacterium RIFCSPHIGHO2_01_FULL_64_10]